MKKEDKEKIKGAVASIAQALELLNKVANDVDPVSEQEISDVDELEDQDSDENMERREKAEELVQKMEDLDEILGRLDEVKTFFEEF